MAAMGPENGSQAGPGVTAAAAAAAAGGGFPSGLQACVTTMHNSQALVYNPVLVQAGRLFVETADQKNQTPAQGASRRGLINLPAPFVNHNASVPGEIPYSFRSPESVEMDEIMAAMVLTSLSCNPVVQSSQLTDTLLGSSSCADMECGGGELSDSGSSGYWSWDHGNVSPAPSPSVPEMDGSPDEGLNMELELGEELHAKRPKSSVKGLYRCLWPSCGKVLTSSVGMKRHIRVLHLGSVFDQSQREEDFYYTRISCETAEPCPAPLLSWASCASPPGSGLQIPPAHRPRSNSGPGPGPGRPGPLSRSAPSSFWQIHSEHLYQACGPVQLPVASRSPSCQGLNPPGHSNTPMEKPRCRSVSVGEQWLQQNRLQTLSASPSRSHCSFRKGRGEAKKCRKVYGVERKDQWCTACRWKKACQRFPD